MKVYDRFQNENGKIMLAEYIDDNVFYTIQDGEVFDDNVLNLKDFNDMLISEHWSELK